ncbi:hypothetical protein ACQP2P_13140 [Dactylosporangium sp. CA-139114]|uniref:hypothetical protein n=1 Tax=Dactylosporangium sp. CA-139114 TaxID=3239931 RepID=UPI003D988EEA
MRAGAGAGGDAVLGRAVAVKTLAAPLAADPLLRAAAPALDERLHHGPLPWPEATAMAAEVDTAPIGSAWCTATSSPATSC